jgi:hypothetical protein
MHPLVPRGDSAQQQLAEEMELRGMNPFMGYSSINETLPTEEIEEDLLWKKCEG